MITRPGPVVLTMLMLGLVFLYVPAVVVIAYSFNESRLVSVWTGFSLKWYGELFDDPRFLSAAGVSLLVAIASASLATLLGTAAGLVLARAGRFRGRLLFSGLAATPLVLPEVITGLTLLLLFVSLEQAIGWPRGRGIATVILAHASFAMAYVALVVQARVAGMARDAEEAAADLGAPPRTVFTAITLPLIMPAIAAGWLLAFVLSLDDLVVASFTSGPQATTLPMLVFSSIRLGVSPKINALSTLLILISAICLLGAVWLHKWRGRAAFQRP